MLMCGNPQVHDRQEIVVGCPQADLFSKKMIKAKVCILENMEFFKGTIKNQYILYSMFESATIHKFVH